ncbi:hypothetical protein SO802_011230 [Lithocarpus litseifolius]|uniref:Exo-beta-D-glucosaminidase Ig-fold domain-containing protein n=1 Tax=Lithocarpus litseifolius TaxID=425828 RepID=A0AAW2D1X9_9ROSI
MVHVFIQGSLWDGFADGKGGFTDGPYGIQNPEEFFKNDFYSHGFNPEVGSVGIPVAETIRATMPQEGWQIPLFKKLPNGYTEEVPNPIWEYHKYIPYLNPKECVDQIELYGAPKDLDDFCLKAQLVNYIQYRALPEGWTSRMWSKYTGVLIWKTKNPWTGLRGQFYDHLLDQTAGFYGCRCAAKPIHVQLNLATYFIEVVNTSSEELSNIAIEASVWDLEGTCPYYKVFENLSAPAKKTELLLVACVWWRLQASRAIQKEKKKPLKITSKVFIKGSTYEIEMHVENVAKKAYSRSLTYMNNFTAKQGNGDFDMASLEPATSGTDKKHEVGLFQRIFRCFTKENGSLKVTEVNGADVGVAFFLHFSVHALKTDHKEGEDTRILSVHYSDNYFSLVPGEVMPIKITFKVPLGVTPRVSLHGWNYHGGHIVL